MEFLTLFAQAMRSQGKQPATIESYSRDAREFLSYLSFYSVPLTKASPEHFTHFQEHLKSIEHDHINSIRRKVIGIRQFFRFMQDQKIISTAPFDEMPIPARLEGLPEVLEVQDVDAILEVASKQHASSLKVARDGLIICLLAYEGLKANEVIDLKWSDILWDHMNATMRISGIKRRVIKLNESTSLQLLQYQQIYKSYFADQNKTIDDFKMIISFKGRDTKFTLPKISRHGLKFTLYELGEKAGLKGLNTELLRHFAMTYLLEQGRSTDEVMHHFGLRRTGNIAKHALRLKKEHQHGTPTSDLHARSPEVSIQSS